MAEKIDLVDKDGIVVRRNVDRNDTAHYDGLYMQIVIAVIRNMDGNFLVHRRAMAKSINPGDIDHVCGGVHAGETPETAVAREALEEGGVTLSSITIVRQGINSYNRYCHLVTATTDDKPDSSHLDPDEVTWAAFYPLAELEAKRDSGEFTYVDGFFEDVDHILQEKTQ